MHFFKSLLAGMALVTLVIAQGLAFTEWPSSVKVGEPVTLKWTGGIADRVGSPILPTPCFANWIILKAGHHQPAERPIGQPGRHRSPDHRSQGRHLRVDTQLEYPGRL